MRAEDLETSVKAVDLALSVRSMAETTAFLIVPAAPEELRAPVSADVVFLTVVPAVVSVLVIVIKKDRVTVPAEVTVPESDLADSLTTEPAVESVPARDCRKVLIGESDPAELIEPRMAAIKLVNLVREPAVERDPTMALKVLTESALAELRAPDKLRIVSRARTLAELREAERGFCPSFTGAPAVASVPATD